MSTGSKTVVFIHGAWMTPECWDSFRTAFEGAGYITHAPAWPYIEGSVSELRRKPPPGLGSLPVGRIVDHYRAYIEKLPEKPLLVGHSFGGLYVQMLLDRGIGAAGVAVDPAPIAGIVPDPVSLSAALPPVLRWNGWNRPFTLSREGFAKSFANTAPADFQKQAYDRLVVPAPGRIFYQAATWIGTSVSPERRAQPLLITVGEKDRTVAPYLAHAAYNRQKKSSARTDFKEFPGVSHFLIAEPGWERVANHLITWAGGL